MNIVINTGKRSYRLFTSNSRLPLKHFNLKCSSSKSIVRSYCSKQSEIARKNRNIAIYAAVGVILLIGLAYLCVPLYRIFCQVTGFGGTPHKATKRHKIDRSKEFCIHFQANVNSDLPWSFTPVQNSTYAYAGENALAFFKATNHSDVPIVGVATYGVFPPQAGVFFEKIECFCFDEQLLAPHETVVMPVLFVLDPEILKAKNMKSEFDITLNYTFFPSIDQTIYDFDYGQRKNEDVDQQKVTEVTGEVPKVISNTVA